MVEITNTELWGKIIAEEVASVNGNRMLTTAETIKFVNALAKATVRIEQSGAFMDFDREADKLIIWSDSNNIYEVNGKAYCECKAFQVGSVCWHRAAKRLVSRYLLAEQLEAIVTAPTTHGMKGFEFISTLPKEHTNGDRSGKGCYGSTPDEAKANLVAHLEGPA